MRGWLEMNPSTVILARGELASLHLRGAMYTFSCMAGRLWLTANGRKEDFVLVPGEKLTLKGRGKVVVEALRRATVRIEILTEVRQEAPAKVPLWRTRDSLLQ